MHERFGELGLESPFDDRVVRAAVARRPHHHRQSPLDGFNEVRLDALLAHETQIDPTSPFWFGLPREDQAAIHPYDDYILARSLVDTEVPEDDLFAGVTSPPSGPEAAVGGRRGWRSAARTGPRGLADAYGDLPARTARDRGGRAHRHGRARRRGQRTGPPSRTAGWSPPAPGHHADPTVTMTSPVHAGRPAGDRERPTRRSPFMQGRTKVAGDQAALLRVLAADGEPRAYRAGDGRGRRSHRACRPDDGGAPVSRRRAGGRASSR